MILLSCDKCGDRAPCFTEVYWPSTQKVVVYRLCLHCQQRLCDAVERFMEESE